MSNIPASKAALDRLAPLLRVLASGVPLLLGVSLVSFLLMVYFGPDQAYVLLGKSATEAQIDEMHRSLGYDRTMLVRYGLYLRELLTLDFGASQSSGEPVSALLARTLPVTLALTLPGFILGNLSGIGLALVCARHRAGWIDRVISASAATLTSISFVIIIIGLQALLSSSSGLDWFPVRGWDASGVVAYLSHVTVPTLALILATAGYNTRFYRAVLIEEVGKPYVCTARAFGAGWRTVLIRHVLRNALIPIITRVLFSIPMILVSGSLLLESYFGIPGLGKATFDAMNTGDQPVLKAVVGLTAVWFVLMLTTADALYRFADPRIVR